MDTLFVRDIYFRDFANNPIPANQPLLSRGDGGTYFTSSMTSTFASPAVNAITAPTSDGGTYEYIASAPYNVFNFEAGGSTEFYSNSSNGGLIIYNTGPEQIIADGQVLPFAILPDYPVGGRTLQYVGTGDTTLQVSDATIFFNSVYYSSLSTVLFLQSTTAGLENELNSSLNILNSLVTSSGLYNYNLISSYFLTPNVINISTVSTSLLVLGDNTIQDNPLRDSIYDPCIVYAGSTLLSTNTDFLTFTDNFSGVTFAIDKEYLYGSSTLLYGPSTTTVTRGQQVQLGWFPTLSTQTNTQSLRSQFVPVVQQIQVLEQLVSTGSYLGGGLYSTTTNYYMKNIGRFDEICNPTKISIIAPVIGATLRKNNLINNSWVQYDTATSTIVWGNNGGTGTLPTDSSNYGDYLFWNGSAWTVGFSTISIGDQAGGGAVIGEGQGEGAIAIGAAAGYSTQGAYSVAVGWLAGQYAQGAGSVAIGLVTGNSNQGVNSVAVGNGAGFFLQGDESIAIGDSAGYQQSTNGIAIGYYAGYSQGYNTIAIGTEAGYGYQNSNSVAIGNYAGGDIQDIESVAIGDSAGVTQSSFAVAIGYYAGTSNQHQGAIAIGSNAGSNSQGAKSIAIGAAAGQLSQGSNAVAIGNTAGYQQSYNSVSIGLNAGFSQQQDAVAIGSFAAASHQHQASIAIGNSAGFTQSSFAIAIGYQAGSGDQSELAIAIGSNAGHLTQGNNTVAIGAGAGYSNQGQFAVAIGAGAGQNDQSTCTIVLNATGFELDTVQASSFYVAPIRYDSTVTTSFLQYNTVTNEVVWNTGTSTMTQSLIPDVDNEYDIGTSTLRLRHLYVGPSSLTIGVGSISADNGGNLFATNAAGVTVAIGGGGSGALATENFCVAVGFGPNRLAYSYDGLTWTPTPTANPFIDNSNAGIFTSWNGSLWISGGYDDTTSYNTLACSSDGIHWLSGEGSAFDSYFICAAWNGTMWIGGGYDSFLGVTLASSYDGIYWTPINVGFFSVCLGIAWNGTMWVAVGVGGGVGNGIFYSYDGFNWTSANVDYVGQCIAWNGKMWVAGAIDVGSAYETIFYSYDGINWNLANSSLEKNCYCIAWNGSVWVAGAGEGPNNPNPNTPYETIAYSTDGIDWSLSESVFEFACSSVAWNGSIFIVTGDDNVNSLGYSYDGIVFQPITNSVFSPGPFSGFGVSSRRVLPYIGTSPAPMVIKSPTANFMVAAGQGPNFLAYSYDGVNWNGLGAGPFNVSGYGICAAWNGSLWLAGGYDSSGNNATIAYSSDGIHWALANSPFQNKCRTIVWNGSIWVAGGEGTNTLAYSYDGINWTGLGTIIVDTSCRSLAWNGTLFVAGGGAAAPGSANTLAYSYDGINWTSLGNSVFTTACYGVACNGSIWVGTGYGTNKLAYSYDGINWTGLGGTVFNTIGYTVAWNGSIWLAGGSDNGVSKIASSYDGIAWSTAATDLPIYSVLTLAWNGSVWIAGGVIASGTNSLFYSSDGTNWTGAGSNLFTGANGVASRNVLPYVGTDPIPFLRGPVVTIGEGAGGYHPQSNSVAIGSGAGLYSNNGIAIGTFAGFSNINSNVNQIAIGSNAGYNNQGSESIAIGTNAGYVDQEYDSVAIGNRAGWSNQGGGSIALGNHAGESNQSPLSIAIGQYAGANNQSTNTIIFNATGGLLNTTYPNAFYVAPIRNDNTISTTVLQYNPQTYEVVWTNANNTPVTDNFTIALGYGPNYIAYSYDGINWTGTKTQVFVNGIGICAAWNGSLWIAGGTDDISSSNTLACSPDGIHWGSLSGQSPFNNACTCIAWNGFIWVAVGEANNTIAYSHDGSHWTGLGTSAFDTAGHCIAWNGTMWVAGGITTVGSPIQISYDGITWTSSAYPAYSYVSIEGVAWNGTLWVACGRNDAGNTALMLYSYNGINWYSASAPNTPFLFNAYSAAWNGFMWVAVGNDGNEEPYTTTAWSYNGINWTNGDLLIPVVKSVTWNGSLWIAGGGDGATTLAYSYNGINWLSLGNTVFPSGTNVQGVVSRNVLPYVGSSPIPFTRMSTIAYGEGAGGIAQGLNAVAIGYYTGESNQAIGGIAIGAYAAQSTQMNTAIAIGYEAGRYNQLSAGVAIGTFAGQSNQGNNTIAIGVAGQSYQSDYAIAMGFFAGREYQSTNAIAIGQYAGNSAQGAYTIALGAYAGSSNQHDNTIVLNATGADFNTIGSNSFYVSPIRSDVGASNGNLLYYDTGTGEIIYDTTKTFVINHPKDASKYLVHACLEGPEAGVYYRGTGTIAELETSVIVELPDYVDALAVDLTVQVTPIYNGAVRVLNASCVSNNKFTVYGDSGDFWWHVYGRRASVDVEPKKSSVSVLGTGPYRWIA